MKLTPLGHRVLVKPENWEEIDPAYKQAKQAGIELPEDFMQVKLEKVNVQRGTVLAIGDTAWQAPELGGKPWCKVGDYILYAKYSGVHVQDKDDHWVVLNDEDVIAVIEKE